MISLFAFIGFLTVILVGSNLMSSGKIKGETILKESKIIEKFNKLVKSLGKRNIDTIKQELCELLDKYRIVKREQFNFNLAAIDKAMKDLNNQHTTLYNTQINLERKVKIKSENKNKTDEDLNEGAQLLYQIDQLKESMTKISALKEGLTIKRDNLLTTIDMFDSALAIKRAEISVMIADSTSATGGSDIDLQLDDLVTEFQNKVIEEKAAQEVAGHMEHKEPSLAFDSAAYIEKFKNL